MKKLISFLLASIMVLCLLTGCKKKDTLQDKPTKVTISETVIYDHNGITITLTEMKTTNLGVEFSVDVRNRSEKNIVISSTHFVVNGITVSGGCFIECNSNRSTQETLYLYKNSLEQAGITTVATVRGVDCSILDSTTFNSLYTFSFDLVTSAGASYQQEINTDGAVLLESNGIKILSQTCTDDTARLVIINNSDKSVIVEAENIKVNGIRVDGKLMDTAFTNTVCFSNLKLSSSALAQANIQSIESLAFTLKIVDTKTYVPVMEPTEVVITIN